MNVSTRPAGEDGSRLHRARGAARIYSSLSSILNCGDGQENCNGDWTMDASCWRVVRADVWILDPWVVFAAINMSSSALKYLEKPNTVCRSMVLGFSGWMDGGDVSTGSIEYMIEKLATVKVAEIQPAGFYIYNFPGPMEFASWQLISAWKPSTMWEVTPGCSSQPGSTPLCNFIERVSPR